MSQISIAEADSLISKLISESIGVHALLSSAVGEARISGFVERKTRQDGIVISSSGAPTIVERGYISVRPFDRRCEVWYGEKREIPPHLQHISDAYGESVLILGFPDSKEWLAIFFTL